MGKKITIKNGHDVFLRAAQPPDAAAFNAYLRRIVTQSDSLASSAEDPLLSDEEERQYLRSLQAGKGNIMLVAEKDGKIIGSIQLRAGARARTRHCAELAVSVDKSWWGLGLATALIQELLAQVRAQKQITVISLSVRADNTAALRLYRAAGFESVGTLKRMLRINGEYADGVYMQLLL